MSIAADEMFKKRFQGLHDLLERQLATYKEEDKALRVSRSACHNHTLLSISLQVGFVKMCKTSEVLPRYCACSCSVLEQGNTSVCFVSLNAKLQQVSFIYSLMFCSIQMLAL